MLEKADVIVGHTVYAELVKKLFPEKRNTRQVEFAVVCSGISQQTMVLKSVVAGVSVNSNNRWDTHPPLWEKIETERSADNARLRTVIFAKIMVVTDRTRTGEPVELNTARRVRSTVFIAHEKYRRKNV